MGRGGAEAAELPGPEALPGESHGTKRGILGYHTYPSFSIYELYIGVGCKLDVRLILE